MGLEITLEELRKQLHYDPDTGEFRWLTKPHRNGGTRKNNPAGYLNAGYRFIRLNGRQYPVHRLAWLYMTGSWPTEQIDHRDCNRENNRWENLREATHSQNSMNRGRMKPHRMKGTWYNRRQGKYVAEIYKDKERRCLGYFETELEAHQAYMAAATELFGEFARAE